MERPAAIVRLRAVVTREDAADGKPFIVIFFALLIVDTSPSKKQKGRDLKKN
jgi:hypothetical protein